MLAAYLVAAILGGTLLVASLVFGHHGGDHDLDHAHAGADGGNFVAGIVLSVRFWTYFLAFGGTSGFLLHLIARTREPLALLLSIGVAAVTGVGAQVAIRRFSSEASGTSSTREMIYRLGTLLLPASPGVPSRVRITINNQLVDLIAVTEDETLEAREEVLVLDVKDGVAHVTRNQPAGVKP